MVRTPLGDQNWTELLDRAWNCATNCRAKNPDLILVRFSSRVIFVELLDGIGLVSPVNHGG